MPKHELHLGENMASVNVVSMIKEEGKDEVMEVPKPMMSLHEVGPPPFLNKTFEMVEDPQSDQIVSWGATFDSFIVWDEHKFCTDCFLCILNTLITPASSVNLTPMDLEKSMIDWSMQIRGSKKAKSIC